MKINSTHYNSQNISNGHKYPAFGKRTLDTVNIRKAANGLGYVDFVKYDMLNPKDRRQFVDLCLMWGKKAPYMDYIACSIHSRVQRFFEKYMPIMVTNKHTIHFKISSSFVSLLIIQNVTLHATRKGINHNTLVPFTSLKNVFPFEYPKIISCNNLGISIIFP